MSDEGIDVELVMRRAIGGDGPAMAWVREHAGSHAGGHPALLALAGILEGRVERIAAAMEVARTTRDRQIVAIAGAHLRGEPQLVDALAREHLVDHPDSVLVAWIAAGAGGRPTL